MSYYRDPVKPEDTHFFMISVNGKLQRTPLLRTLCTARKAIGRLFPVNIADRIVIHRFTVRDSYEVTEHEGSYYVSERLEHVVKRSKSFNQILQNKTTYKRSSTEFSRTLAKAQTKSRMERHDSLDQSQTPETQTTTEVNQ